MVSTNSEIKDTMELQNNKNIILFGGQSSDWLNELRMLSSSPEVRDLLHNIETTLQKHIENPQLKSSGMLAHGVYPYSWVSGQMPVPDSSYLSSSAVSQAMLFITSVAHSVSAGIFPDTMDKIGAISGHSQGVVAALSVSWGKKICLETAGIISVYLVYQGVRMQQSSGFFPTAKAYDGSVLTPMLSISGIERTFLEKMLSGFEDSVSISLKNSNDRYVLSGNPVHISAVLDRLNKATDTRSIFSLSWDWEPLNVSGPFHSPHMAIGRNLIDIDLQDINFSFNDYKPLCRVYGCDYGSRLDSIEDCHRHILDIQYTGTVDWVKTLETILDENPDSAFIIPGPGEGLFKLTKSIFRGSSTPVKRFPNDPDDLDYVNAGPEWFSLKTARKPVIMGGMTPTTAEPEIVVAAANGGFVSELAGGGQVTEEIFRKNMEDIRKNIHGRYGVVINTLYLDPWLWNLHIVEKGLVFKLKSEGYPIVGLTISAGIPSLSEAHQLLLKLEKHGIWLNSFKVGTPSQIDEVLAIAKNYPEHNFILQIEGGEAGGHHSKYPLKNLLSRFYNRIRSYPQILLAAGGGIASEEDATTLLEGTWTESKFKKPVDAVIIGTAVMAAKEARTAERVKDLLVATGGIDNPLHEKSPYVINGISSLGAPIWYLNNNAAKTADFLQKSISGNMDKNKILSLLEKSPKPWFGNISEMSYYTFVKRFVLLCTRHDESDEFIADNHKLAFRNILERILERVDGAEILEELIGKKPLAQIDLISDRYPVLKEKRIISADSGYFENNFKLPGKPFPFIYTIDETTARQYLSDSLFYCHDDKNDPAEVIVIPSPRSISAIKVKNEPVCDILEKYYKPVIKTRSNPVNSDGVIKGKEIYTRLTPMVHPALGRVLASEVFMTENGEETSVLKKLFSKNKSYRYKISYLGTSLTIEENKKSRLHLHYENNHVTGIFSLEIFDERDATLFLKFSLEQSDSVFFHKLDFEQSISSLYKNNIFNRPVSATAYSGMLKRYSGSGSNFLPWFASFALPDMVDRVDSSPLGLVHYRSCVREIPHGRELPECLVTSAGDHYRQIVDFSGRKYEVEGEFFSRLKKRAGFESLEPSEFSRMKTLFEQEVIVGSFPLTAPEDSTPFGLASGDLNPLHSDDSIARLAGFEKRIVHGMWTMAVATAEFEKFLTDGTRIVETEARFLSPVYPGERLQVEVRKVGRAEGAHIYKITVSGDTGPCCELETVCSPVSTAYICPGQGVQKAGMHKRVMEDSAAGADVWKKSDEWTRKNLGFSLLDIVENNPESIDINGKILRHPKGVLNLTQFTQVSLVVLACSQIAELKESGCIVDNAAFGGHSLGEYSALSSIGDILTLENVVRVVYHRGLTMQNFVPRDDKGVSPFKMGVVRPNHAGISENDLFQMVEEISKNPQDRIEIVNYNARGRQYSITGYISGLEKLKEMLGDGVTGKPPWIEVPGIDVPFHSSFLRNGVDAFRKTLQEIFPESIDPERLVNRYWPDLTGEVFDITQLYLEKVLKITDSPILKDVLDRMGKGTILPGEIASKLLIELLAYQFASPVQWIKIQEGMLDQGIHEIIEIGPGHQPTLTNLMQLAKSIHAPSAPCSVLHLENSIAVVHGKAPDKDLVSIPVFIEEPTSPTEVIDVSAVKKQDSIKADSQISSAKPAQSSKLPSAGYVAVKAFLANATGSFTSDISNDNTIEELLQGNSARRNQMLSELQKEFGFSSTDGLADKKIAELISIVEKLNDYRFPGELLKKAIGSFCKEASNIDLTKLTNFLQSEYGLDAISTQICLVILSPYSNAGKSRLSGSVNPLVSAGYKPSDGIDFVRNSLESGIVENIRLVKMGNASSQGSKMVSSEALDSLRNEIYGENGIFSKLKKALDGEKERLVLPTVSEPEYKYTAWEEPAFDPERAIELSSYRNWIRESVFRVVNKVTEGIDLNEEDILNLNRDSDYSRKILNFQAKTGSSPEKIESVFKLLKVDSEIKLLPSLNLTKTMSGGTSQIDIKLDPEKKIHAIITGAGPGSIAEQILCGVISSGGTAITGVSSLNEKRIIYFASLYRKHCRPGSKLFIVPFRQGNYEDCRNFANWCSGIFKADDEVSLYPFAALGMNGYSEDISNDFDRAVRVNLTGVTSLTGHLARYWETTGKRIPLRTILPMSPNHGVMGGDGLYGETKAALGVLLNKWHSEPILKKNTWMCGAVIGWVRGTGLMGSQDMLASLIEEKIGIKTWSTVEMAKYLLALPDISNIVDTSSEVDLTGGISSVPDWGEQVRNIRLSLKKQIPATNKVSERKQSDAIHILKSKSNYSANVNRKKLSTNLSPDQILVISGYGEIGPFGDEQARWEYEISGEFSELSILRNSVQSGLVKWNPQKNLYATTDGQFLTEMQVVEKFRDYFKKNIGVRYKNNSTSALDTYESVEEITLIEDIEFKVDSLDTARLLQMSDPENTYITSDENGAWKLVRKKGSTINIPVIRKMKNNVAGMVPDGWDLRHIGLPESDASDIDRNSQFMIFSVLKALHNARTDMTDLISSIHASAIGNSIGTGIGGMERLIRLYTDPVLNKKRDPISLQESLGNVGPGHVSQEILGNYGPMISPVAACATAGVSIESACEKILMGKAELVFAGASDDLSYAGTVGFDDMAATVDMDFMTKHAISPARMSRPHDTMRKGFIESQGGGTVIITRLSTAMNLGLPVHAIIGGSWTFGDGHSKSIPAPGYGLLSVARNGKDSFLSKALASFNLTIDDIDLVSMHGTSTPVNDPHESQIYRDIFKKLGRSPALPAMVISQKGITGHPKGGAASFQINGVIQAMRDSVIPPHRNLDNPDKVMDQIETLIYPSEPVDFKNRIIRAALISTLGFGHVSSMMLILNPAFVEDFISSEQFKEWKNKKTLRENRFDSASYSLGTENFIKLNREKPFTDSNDEKNYLLGGEN
ncbi:DUF1729 domain-containing protein [Myxococcota bacterium]|nr:DUF1729 domain-containing protein [Myxococcota bacterium]MBU1380555.1 DUF1729 domain-containing protein [Myxococcota bacterium]MBU1497895.1 DUF1729 domain-containing protein [Myxococcota bacterium]